MPITALQEANISALNEGDKISYEVEEEMVDKALLI